MSDLRAVKRYAAQHDLFNRLHSISADERFVRDVAQDWFQGRFEVVPNQRCGNWYCDPSTSSKAYAYFKSTDGHMTQWDFNLRRSNLNLAKYAEDHGGLILVDSTRRGKRMPDGLSKTVPIWCCVINLAIELRRNIPLDEDWDTELYLPPKVVSPSEKSQIEERLDEWAETLESSSLPLPNLAKPLRPFFIHPSTSTSPHIPANPPYTPIICLSASRWVNHPDDQIPSVTRLGDSSMTVGFDYVPGAGDDDELWARGLTPRLFHSHKTELLQAERDDLPSLVDEIVLSNSMSKLPSPSTSTSGENAIGIPSSSSRVALDIGSPIMPSATPWLYSNSDARYIVIRVVEYEKYPRDIPRLLNLKKGEVWVLAVANSKTEGKAYESSLKELVEFVRSADRAVVLVHGSSNDVESGIMIRQQSPRDGTSSSGDQGREVTLDALPEPSVEGRKLILPLALALICSIENLDDKQPEQRESEDASQERTMSKTDIATKLHGLVSLWPDGNPPRASLKRINEFLMSGDRRD
ncbi:hypothetical protein I302_106229 [Kwoniella bestiolae CBS 10118]|uniref:Initiator tRNA phosphoribosyl transferase n=1 Tax=Kwoniella bestiolae CBS 10118 TaxID=1296100 RepID=A0A1B9G3D4_9TREE|nr:hypothetical protein I302_05353 [Kwoniella bestiolae CBS 10118]OCF25533.1 hypothetical protein I302_05353 [Kwoniella bestiolae CBS 10118]